MRSGALKASLKLTLEFLKGIRGDVVPQNFSLKSFDDLPFDRIAANHWGVRTYTRILMKRAAVLGPPNPPNPTSARYQHHVRSAQAAFQKPGEEIFRRVRSRGKAGRASAGEHRIDCGEA